MCTASKVNASVVILTFDVYVTSSPLRFFHSVRMHGRGLVTRFCAICTYEEIRNNAVSRAMITRGDRES